MENNPVLPLPPNHPEAGFDLEAKPKTSLAELNRRQGLADAESHDLRARIKVPAGLIVRVDSIPDSDYLAVFTDIGTTVTLHRVEAIERLGAMFSLIMNSTGVDRAEEVERDIECCIMIFRAICKNGESRGKRYSSNYVKEFERMLLDIYKKYKNRPDRVKEWNPSGAPREFEISTEGKIIPIIKNPE